MSLGHPAKHHFLEASIYETYRGVDLNQERLGYNPATYSDFPESIGGITFLPLR